MWHDLEKQTLFFAREALYEQVDSLSYSTGTLDPFSQACYVHFIKLCQSLQIRGNATSPFVDY